MKFRKGKCEDAAKSVKGRMQESVVNKLGKKIGQMVRTSLKTVRQG